MTRIIEIGATSASAWGRRSQWAAHRERGDGLNWLERLTANLKEFKTNVQMDNSLTVVGAVQASSFVSTGSGAWNITGNSGTLSPAAAGVIVRIGTKGKCQVSENGGAVVEVAKLNVNGNFAGNSVTASVWRKRPGGCSGGFATGIQANGDANCSLANVVTGRNNSAERIANYGIFWFDQICHCPKVIDDNGQAVQLGLTNVFNADANTLEEYNGTNPQVLRMYRTRTDASDYGRFGLKWDNPPMATSRWPAKTRGQDSNAESAFGSAARCGGRLIHRRT